MALRFATLDDILFSHVITPNHFVTCIAPKSAEGCDIGFFVSNSKGSGK